MLFSGGGDPWRRGGGVNVNFENVAFHTEIVIRPSQIGRDGTNFLSKLFGEGAGALRTIRAMHPWNVGASASCCIWCGCHVHQGRPKQKRI